jgi:hypothetical protein
MLKMANQVLLELLYVAIPVLILYALACLCSNPGRHKAGWEVMLLLVMSFGMLAIRDLALLVANPPEVMESLVEDLTLPFTFAIFVMILQAGEVFYDLIICKFAVKFKWLRRSTPPQPPTTL